jgi:hypothetical protein
MYKKPTVLISYHRADLKWKQRLRRHLSILESRGLIEIWDDEGISPGADRDSEISSAVQRSSMAILLISSDFLHSNELMQQFFRLQERRQDGDDVLILPVILRFCAWEELPSLRSLQVRPSPSRPVQSGPSSDPDLDFANLTREVRVEIAESRRRQFAEFFGATTFDSRCSLVFTKRECTDLSSFHYPEAKRLGAQFATENKPPSPKDVAAWLAYEDIRAGAYLGKLFGDAAHQFVRFELDHDIGDESWKRQPTIAVGLGFNSHTHRLINSTTVRQSISILWQKYWAAGFDAYTDVFTFCGTSATLSASRDHAIIVRVAGQALGHVHFICAGFTAPGTASAGYYLSNNWTTLLKLYRSDKSLGLSTHHLVALLSCPVDGADTNVLDASSTLEQYQFVAVR